MATLSWLLSGIFSPASAAEYPLAESYVGLRNMLFTARPDALGLRPKASETWGVVMETGYPEGVVTLFTLADGTVSMYFSNGGGMIGMGANPGPRKAAKALLSLAQEYSKYGVAGEKHPLPNPSYTRFYFLKGNGVSAIEAKEDDMVNGHHQLSPLFYKAQELITEIRLVVEKRRAEQHSAPGASR